LSIENKPFFFFKTYSEVLTVFGINPSSFTKSHSQTPYLLESLGWINLFLYHNVWKYRYLRI